MPRSASTAQTASLASICRKSSCTGLANAASPREVAHLFIALDPRALGEPERSAARMRAYLDWIRQQETQTGAPGVVPGDLERQACARRSDELVVEPAVAAALEL